MRAEISFYSTALGTFSTNKSPGKTMATRKHLRRRTQNARSRPSPSARGNGCASRGKRSTVQNAAAAATGGSDYYRLTLLAAAQPFCVRPLGAVRGFRRRPERRVPPAPRDRLAAAEIGYTFPNPNVPSILPPYTYATLVVIPENFFSSRDGF